MTAPSCAGMNGAATRSSAASSPVANEPATIQPMDPLGGVVEWSPVSLLVGVRVAAVLITVSLSRG